MHCESEHSALEIHFLGLNDARWMKQELDPRFAHSPEIAYAIQTTRINMANPDEESETIAFYVSADSTLSITMR